jgi:hypothetical protein
MTEVTVKIRVEDFETGYYNDFITQIEADLDRSIENQIRDIFETPRLTVTEFTWSEDLNAFK